MRNDVVYISTKTSEIELSRESMDLVKTIISVSSVYLASAILAFKDKVLTKKYRLYILEKDSYVFISCDNIKLIIPFSKINFILTESYPSKR